MANSSNPMSVIPFSVKAIFKELDPALKITTMLLNRTIYLIWAKSASHYLCGKGKLGYINGKVLRPEDSEVTYAEWELNDLTVMSWLLNLMEPLRAEDFLFLDSTNEIWDVAVEIYGEKEVQVYQL